MWITCLGVLRAEDKPPVNAAQTVYASAAETTLRAELTAHLQPLLAFNIDGAQLAAAKRALAAIGGGKFEAAANESAAITEPAAVRLVEWQRLLRAGPSLPPAAYQTFLSANPVWPDRERLEQLFERALLREGGGARQIAAYFSGREPVSGAGHAALASAELALGHKDKARQRAARAWCFDRFLESNEGSILARFDPLLVEADHKCRLDRLLVSSTRDKAIRQSRIKAAERLLPKLSPPERQKAVARIKVYGGAGLKELSAVVSQPALIKDDWGLAYQRIWRARNAKDYEQAYTLLKAVPGDHPRFINRDEWWEERERNARYWLAEGNVSRAYEIVEGVRPENAPESINAAKEQAFFSGWLALVRLNKPMLAVPHFKRMVALADGPLSKSMAEFWLASAYEKLGNRKLAEQHYQASAAIRDTFHGLLARRAAWPTSRAIELPQAAAPTPADVQRFTGLDPIKSLLVAYKVDLPRRDILDFYKLFAAELKTEGELALLAQLANLLGDGQGEVRTGKAGVSRGFSLYEFAYPVHRLPNYEALRAPVEPALLLAIARQESEFNTEIVSRAGARGVLQVMPITARHICRQYRIKCDISELLSDPSYNARIASAYIADRRDEFGGSYILTLTGFNAGPGRTRQWLRQMGDPRAASVKPLDWIYRIPFLETRLYVRKVLSNVQIYRARLGEKDPLRLDQDLRRGSL